MIISNDKYPGVFSLQMEAIVSTILQMLFATRAVLSIGEYPWPSFSCGIHCHVTHLDESRISENI